MWGNCCKVNALIEVGIFSSSLDRYADQFIEFYFEMSPLLVMATSLYSENCAMNEELYCHHTMPFLVTNV